MSRLQIRIDINYITNDAQWITLGTLYKDINIETEAPAIFKDLLHSLVEMLLKREETHA
jgi:hypothetical protein